MISANNVTLRIGKKALLKDVNIKIYWKKLLRVDGKCGKLFSRNSPEYRKSTFIIPQQLPIAPRILYGYLIMGNANSMNHEKKMLIYVKNFSDEMGASELERFEIWRAGRPSRSATTALNSCTIRSLSFNEIILSPNHLTG